MGHPLVISNKISAKACISVKQSVSYARADVLKIGLGLLLWLDA